MDTLAVATILAALVLLASMASVELGISVAIIEIALGVLAGNVLGITFLAQRFFSPPIHELSPSDAEAIEDEEFEPSH